jgi:outer membrane biosynthesis protein TonB
MRIELGISAAAHTAILVASVLGLPGAEAYKVDDVPNVPVEILTVEEFDRIAARKTETPPERVEKAAPEAPQPIETPPVRAPEPTEAEAAPPKQVAALEPEPEPAPTIELKEVPLSLPEPLAEPEPEPAPEPVAEPEPLPEPEKAETPPAVPSVQAPAPRAKPTPPKTAAAPVRTTPPKPVRKKKEFDPDQIAALLNKVQDKPAAAPLPASRGVADDAPTDVSGFDTQVTQSEMRYLQGQMERCWNPPVAVPNAASLAVRVEVNFSPDGRLVTQPVVLNSGGEGFDVAADAAVRAVQQCQPYDMPPEKYDTWREVIVNFDPRLMLGG